MRSPPKGESAEPASERQENKKHFTIFKLVHNFFALRDYPDIHTEQTRISSVIYPRQTTNHSKNKYPNLTHHEVFFNTERRDSHPYGLICITRGGRTQAAQGERMAIAERHPRRRHAAKGIEPGT